MSDPSTEIEKLRERLSPMRRRCVECGRNRRIALVHQVDGDWLCLPGDCSAAGAAEAAESVVASAKRTADVYRPGPSQLEHFQRLADTYKENVLSSAVDALVAEVRSLRAALRDNPCDILALHAAVPRWAEGKTLVERVSHLATLAARSL